MSDEADAGLGAGLKADLKATVAQVFDGVAGEVECAIGAAFDEEAAFDEGEVGEV